MWKHQVIIFFKNVLIGRVLFLIYCALSEYKHFEQLTHVVFWFFKKKIELCKFWMQKRLKYWILHFHWVISHYTVHAIFFLVCQISGLFHIYFVYHDTIFFVSQDTCIMIETHTQHQLVKYHTLALWSVLSCLVQ